MNSTNLNEFFDEDDGRVCIIAEVAQTHDGSLGSAHAFIDAVAKTGVDVIKFQTHIADAESTPDEPFRVPFSYEDKTRYDYWKRLEFSEQDWYGLFKHSHEKGLIFLSSPFSVEAVEMLERIGVCAWKLGSGEIYNLILLDKVINTKKPILLSTGFASISETDHIISRLDKSKIKYAILQCTTEYPCPPEKIGLNIISLFMERYKCPVGLSDHSGTVYPSLSAVTLGAKFIEVHVTLSRDMFGPDVPASLTIKEMKLLVDGIRYIERILKNPVDKDVMAQELCAMKSIFTKSIVIKQDLPAGTVLDMSMLALKKPAGGMTPSELDNVIGKRLLVDVNKNTMLKKSYFTEETD